ncbi:MAG: acetylglutamate kinase [Promethearchaeota archaeon]
MIDKLGKAKILVEALQYIKKFYGKTVIIKFGGSAMKDPKLKKSFVEDVVSMNLVDINLIIVHGGGPIINEMLKKLEIEPKFFNGLRVTDKETMDVVEMVLAGKINKSIVNDIQTQGANAIGICGKDSNLLQVKKKIVDGKDLGFVGEVVNVNTKFLQGILDNSVIPVIAPIGKDNLGNTFNINADDVALAISKALRAEKLIYLTDVLGVLSDLNDDTSLIKEMKVDQALTFIKEGIITDGMIPKVRCSIEAIQSGVTAVHIIDGRIDHSLLLEIFTPHGIGTMFKKSD